MGENIESVQQYADTPEGWARRWTVEITAAKDALKAWRDPGGRGDKVIDRYVDERPTDSDRKRLNLFHGDVQTKRALLYGNPPRVRCRRRHADADDDVARVSAEMLERVLNTDIDRDGDGYVESLGLARDDRLLPGLGQVRSRYVAEFEPTPAQPAQMGPCPACQGMTATPMMGSGGEAMEAACPTCNGAREVELAPAVPAGERKSFEDVETEHVHWNQFLYAVRRKWAEVDWVDFPVEMSRDDLHKRFDDVEWMGPERVNAIALESPNKSEKHRGDDPWSRVVVHEIWCRSAKRVFHFVEGFDVCLDIKDDPLGLEGFFPCPRPLMANTTTRRLTPVPDFAIAQDLYQEIDDLYDRIYELTKSLRVVGWYDRQYASPLSALIGGGENTMIPVEAFTQAQELGGLKGLVEFFPIDPIAQVIVALSDQLRAKIVMKDQVTGIADVMRGAATGAATATEQRIKARFGSTRIQAAQDEFARFTTDTQKIRAEIIAKHWDAQTIIDRSNVLRTPDKELAQQAADLIKQGAGEYRIEVASDALAMTDFDALKGDRVEFLQATALFLKEVGAVAPVAPQAVPFLLEFLRHGVTGFRGAAQLEGVLDRMIGAAQKAADAAQQQAMQPKPPDPKVQAAQIGLQSKKMEAGAKQAQAQADIQGTVLDAKVKVAEHQMDMQKLALETKRDMVRAAMPGPEEAP
jgi:hypothetical protein